jgi:NADPH:quinone reductase-like Zn-dependent oxidoreductase
MKIKRFLKWSALAILLLLFAWFQFAYWSSTNDCNHNIPPGVERMKAVRHCEYGPPEVLKIGEIAKPLPKDDELLVRVRAGSLNFIDAALLGGPLIGRLIFGLRKPKLTGLGQDFAGVIEAVGKNVTEFKPGDGVFGGKTFSSVAEYVCVRKDRVALKPANISFEQAGAVKHAGLTALQGLRTGKIHGGQKVLINGASGGVGTFAVQIAKAFDTEVTAVCSTRNVEMARTLGADHVIDYTKEDFTKRDERYDLLFDNVNNHSMAERRRILKPDGICVLAGVGGAGSKGLLGRIARNFGVALWSRLTDHKFAQYTTRMDQADLKFLGDLIAEGKVTPFVEKTYPMSETPNAMRYFEEGHARGKIVITVD